MANNPYDAAYSAVRAAIGRPEHTRLVKQGEVVTFQIMDAVVSDVLASPIHQVATPTCANKALASAADNAHPADIVVTLFGCTEEGHSVCARLNGFSPSAHFVAGNRARPDTLRNLQAMLRSRGYTTKEVEHYNFWGFEYDPARRDRKKKRCVRVSARTMQQYRQLRWVANGMDVRLVEHDKVPLYTKFFDETQLAPFDWVDVTCTHTPTGVISTCDVELESCVARVVARPELQHPAPWLFASCDIEAMSSRGGKEFPNALHADDVVFCVCVAFERQGRRTLVALVLHPEMPGAEAGKTTTLHGADGPITVIKYASERLLLTGWRDLVCVYADADVVTWYNGFKFDLPYMATRVLGAPPTPDRCGSKFFQFSKFVRAVTPMKAKEQSSNNTGDTDIVTYTAEYGRITLDLFEKILKCEKLSSYQLKDVAREFLTETGGTVSWQRGTDKVVGTGTKFVGRVGRGDHVQLGDEFYKIADVADDTHLTLAEVPTDLDGVIQDRRFVGKVTKLDMEYSRLFELYAARQYDDVIDYCMRDCVAPLRIIARKMYWLADMEMCKITKTTASDLYGRGQGIRGLNGCIWFAHKQGFLVDVPAATIADKYKGATVVDPKKGFFFDPVATLDFASLYPSIIIAYWLCWSTLVMDPAHGAHVDVEYEDVFVSEGRTFRWARRMRVGDDMQRVVCVLPQMEQHLLAERKKIKRAMGAAYKAGDAALGDILNAKQLSTKLMANSMYGLTGAGTSAMCLQAIAECVTAIGRQTLERTKSLSVDWLAQHSVDAEIVYGDSVDGDCPVLLRVDGVIEVLTIGQLWERHGAGELAERYGGAAPIEDGKRYVTVEGIEAWSDGGWTPVRRIMGHATRKPLYRVCTPTGVVVVTRDHSLLTPDGTPVTPAQKPTELMTAWPAWPADAKRKPRVERLASLSNLEHYSAQGFISARFHGSRVVPADLLRRSRRSRQAFFDKACSGGSVVADDQLNAARWYALLRSLGHDALILPEGDSFHVFYGVDAACAGRVVSIEEVPNRGGMVFDLTTDSGHFQAGVGQLIVHNTDSVMVKMALPRTPEDTDLTVATTAWNWGEQCADAVTAALGNGIVLECEKVYLPYLIQRKKHYAGIKYEGPPPFKPCRQVRGLEMVKRSTSEFVRRAQTRVIDRLLDTRDERAGLEMLVSYVEQLATGKVAVADLTTSAKLKREYAGKPPAHWQVNQRRHERTPGAEYKAGDRVPMVAVSSRRDGRNLTGASVTDIMDDPEWVVQHNWPVNKYYYLEQFRQVMRRVFLDRAPQVDCMFNAALNYLSSECYRLPAFMKPDLTAQMLRCAQGDRLAEQNSQSAMARKKLKLNTCTSGALKKSDAKPLDARAVKSNILDDLWG